MSDTSPVSSDSYVGADLVARIAAGDRLAEHEFVRQYERGVRILVRRHCRPNDPIFEDISQEVLSRVLEKLRAGALDDSRALASYVQMTVVHTTQAEYRQRKSMESLAAAVHVATADDPVRNIESVQLAALVRKVLAQLPVERDRDVLRLFYIEERDKGDICARLMIDESHFHRVIFRARMRFRELITVFHSAQSST